jgi:hypothetical protein
MAILSSLNGMPRLSEGRRESYSNTAPPACGAAFFPATPVEVGPTSRDESVRHHGLLDVYIRQLKV